jgi:hypothetical protein
MNKMTNIEIIFNKESYIANYVEESIKLISSFKYNEEIKIESIIEDIIFPNRHELIKLFEKLRGSDNSNLKLKFYESNLMKWANANFYEQQSFKSLVLIYHWLELALSNPEDLDVKKNLYNEFIVDWNFSPGFQNTIFLIPEKYLQKSDQVNLLDNLVTVNLLCKIIITNKKTRYVNYFIPLLTPGVPIDYYKTEFDKDGLKSHELWKSLLEDRDIRIKNWVNNRF